MARERKSKVLSYTKCSQCRRDRQRCAPIDRQWPARCNRCEQYDYPCSRNYTKLNDPNVPRCSFCKTDKQTCVRKGSWPDIICERCQREGLECSEDISHDLEEDSDAISRNNTQSPTEESSTIRDTLELVQEMDFLQYLLGYRNDIMNLEWEDWFQGGEKFYLSKDWSPSLYRVREWAGRKLARTKQDILLAMDAHFAKGKNIEGQLLSSRLYVDRYEELSGERFINAGIEFCTRAVDADLRLKLVFTAMVKQEKIVQKLLSNLQDLKLKTVTADRDIVGPSESGPSGTYRLPLTLDDIISRDLIVDSDSPFHESEEQQFNDSIDEAVEKLIDMYQTASDITASLLATLNFATEVQVQPSDDMLDSYSAADIFSPLHRACSIPHTKVAQRVLDRWGWTIHHRTVTGETALHVAIRCNNLEIARLLHLRQELSCEDTQDEGHRTPIMWACINKMPLDFLSSLMKTDTDYDPVHGLHAIDTVYGTFNLDSPRGRRPVAMNTLQLLSWLGHLEAMKYLISKGSDPNAPACHQFRSVKRPSIVGMTALSAAAWRRKSDAIHLLLKNGARADESIRQHSPVLWLAATKNWEQGVELHIRYGANTKGLLSGTEPESLFSATDSTFLNANQKSDIFMTLMQWCPRPLPTRLLHTAVLATQGSLEAVQYLLQEGFHPGAMHDGHSVFDVVARQKNSSLLSFLLEHYPFMSMTMPSGNQHTFNQNAISEPRNHILPGSDNAPCFSETNPFYMATLKFEEIWESGSSFDRFVGIMELLNLVRQINVPEVTELADSLSRLPSCEILRIVLCTKPQGASDGDHTRESILQFLRNH